MRKLQGIAPIALVHLACSFALFWVTFGIAMKSFDRPHVLTFSERIWTSLAQIMFLPVAAPLHYLAKDMIEPSRVRGLVAVIWMFGPLVLNSVLWAVVLWWGYSRVRRRPGGVHPA